MQQSDFQVFENSAAEIAIHFHGGLKFTLFVFGDHWIDHISLMSGGHLLANELPDFRGLFIGADAGVYGCASWRQFVEHAQIEIAVQRQRQRARDRRRRHHQNIRFRGC